MQHFATTCIDNFFKHPDSICKYAHSLKYKSAENGKWPGVRSEALHLLDPDLNRIICDKYLCNFYTTSEVKDNFMAVRSTAYFQKVSSKYGEGWVHPDLRTLHTTIFYLTPNASYDSGTSIWIPKKDSMPIVSSFSDLNKVKAKEDFYKGKISLKDSKRERLKYNSQFDEVIRFANIYNRCIGFDGCHWHSANNFSNNEEERLTLIIFWAEIIGTQTGLQRTQMEVI